MILNYHKINHMFPRSDFNRNIVVIFGRERCADDRNDSPQTWSDNLWLILSCTTLSIKSLSTIPYHYFHKMHFLALSAVANDDENTTKSRFLTELLTCTTIRGLHTGIIFGQVLHYYIIHAILNCASPVSLVPDTDKFPPISLQEDQLSLKLKALIPQLSAQGEDAARRARVRTGTYRYITKCGK